MVETMRRMMAPYLRLTRMMVGRAVVNLVNDALKMQTLQVTLLADEVRSDVERMQEYGFTSHPVPGAEAVMVCVGGARDHGIVIAVDDRRYRLKGLKQGEVALYDDQGQVVHLKRGKKIHVSGCNEIVAGAAVSATCTAPEVTVSSAAINLGGERSTLRALVDERFVEAFNKHEHSTAGAPTVSLAVADVATGVTKGI